jgi:hypothetical protein
MNVTIPLHDTSSLYFHNALSWAEMLGFDFEQELALHFRTVLAPSWGPLSYWRFFFSVVKSGRIEKLIIFLKRVPNLRTHGAVPPFTHPCSWFGVDTQEYLFIFTISNTSVPTE